VFSVTLFFCSLHEPLPEDVSVVDEPVPVEPVAEGEEEESVPEAEAGMEEADAEPDAEGEGEEGVELGDTTEAELELPEEPDPEEPPALFPLAISSVEGMAGPGKT